MQTGCGHKDRRGAASAPSSGDLAQGLTTDCCRDKVAVDKFEREGMGVAPKE